MVTFRSFIVGTGNDVLSDWYAAYPFEKERWQNLWARYFAMHMHLSAQPIGGWSDNYFHKMAGYEGLGRIGFDYKGIAFRHLGFYGPGGNEFTILYCAVEKSWKYLPKGCIEEVYSRMSIVKANPERARLATIRTPGE